MRFDVFTLFPEVFSPYLETSIMKVARRRELVHVHIHNIRDWAHDKHRVTDSEPYGGGGGMIMKPEPIFKAVEHVLGSPPSCPVILLSPQGRPLTQSIATEFARLDHVAMICGRYEGVDERVRQHLVQHEISIGDYVLTGGELPALIVIDAVSRLLPGVLGDPSASAHDSHATGLLEGPHYTRPPEFRGWHVPEVLLSGDHARIATWRRQEALRRTFERRPDLLAHLDLTEEDQSFLDGLTKHNPEEKTR
jgi:tRNA (guanine37-N1)-methyltransferase